MEPDDAEDAGEAAQGRDAHSDLDVEPEAPRSERGASPPLETEATPIGTESTIPASLDDFYRSTHGGMVRFAFLLTGSREVAQDLVQDCFVRLHPRWGSIEQPLAYLRRSVVNACRSHHRTRARRERIPLPAPEPTSLDADELGDALRALPHRQRAALVLRFYDGLSQSETAEMIGCRPGTVASLVHRGLAALREVIEP